MALVSRLSLSTYLKNFFGVRGGYGPGVDESIAPVFDVATPDPINDDLVIYWAFSINQAAVAGNFNFTGFSPQAGGRLIVDRILCNPSTVSTKIRVARQPAQVAALYGNASLSIGAGSFGAGPPGVRQGNQVGDPITQGTFMSVEVVASPGQPILVPVSAACKQGEELLFTTTVVNSLHNLSVFGRMFPSFPE